MKRPYPISRFAHWRHLNSEYTTDFSLITKMKKLTKYQISEFRKHGLNEIDAYIASFNPTKKQFTFMRDIIMKKEFELKQKYK